MNSEWRLSTEPPYLYHQDEPYDFSADVHDGWVPLLQGAFRKIAELYVEQGVDLTKLWVLQIKEKFGTLRLYADFSVEGADAVVRQAERNSGTICEFCGAQGELRTDIGWIKTLCETHYRKIKR